MALWDNPNAWPVVDLDSPLGKVTQYNNLSDAVQRWRGNVNANNKALDNLVATTYRLAAVTGSQAGVSVQNRLGNNRFLFSANAAAGSGGSDYTDFVDHDIATKKTFTNGAWQMNGAVLVNNLLTANNAFVPGQINTPSLTNGAGSPINFQDSFLDRVYAMQFKCLNPTSNNIVAGSAPLLNFQIITNGGNSSGVNDRLIFYGITKISDTALSATSLMELWRDSSQVRFPTSVVFSSSVDITNSTLTAYAIKGWVNDYVCRLPSSANNPDGPSFSFNAKGQPDVLTFFSRTKQTDGSLNAVPMVHFKRDPNIVEFVSEVRVNKLSNGPGGEIFVNSSYLQNVWVLNMTCYSPQSSTRPGVPNFQIAAFGAAGGLADKLQISRLNNSDILIEMMSFFRDTGKIQFSNAGFLQIDGITYHNNSTFIGSSSDLNRTVGFEKHPNWASMIVHTNGGSGLSSMDMATQSRNSGLIIRSNYALLPVYMQNVAYGVWPGDGVLLTGDLLIYQSSSNSQLRFRMRCGDGAVRDGFINLS